MKKSDLILVGLVLVIVVVAMFSSKGTQSLDDVDYPLTLSGEVGLHQITYGEYEYFVDSDTKYYLKTLSNSINDIDNVKVTYDPISREQFDFLLDNYSLLKTFIWLDNDDTARNVLLYSSNNIELVME